MPAKTVIVGSAIGLHARPAAIIAEAVVNAGVPVTLSMDDGEPVDAGSALMIMTLGAGQGQRSITRHESYPMSYGPERRKPAVFADRSGDSAFDRSPEQLNPRAATDPHYARQVVTPAHSGPRLSRNGLLLLIAGLAFLVAIGVLTN